jgi:hypothetical protein
MKKLPKVFQFAVILKIFHPQNTVIRSLSDCSISSNSKSKHSSLLCLFNSGVPHARHEAGRRRGGVVLSLGISVGFQTLFQVTHPTLEHFVLPLHRLKFGFVMCRLFIATTRGNR